MIIRTDETELREKLIDAFRGGARSPLAQADYIMRILSQYRDRELEADYEHQQSVATADALWAKLDRL